MTGHQERERLWKLWTPHDVQMLEEMWRAKNSASEIAAALSTGKRTFTRNAIIGKINRLGLQGEGRLAPKFTKSKKRKPRAPRPTLPSPAIPEAPLDAYDAVLDDLRRQRGHITTAIHLLETQPTAPAPAPARLTPAAVEVVSLDIEFPTAVEIGEDVALPVSDRVTIADVGPGICRYPLGDPLATDFTFCGDACDITRPYCETHHKIAYVPIAKFKTDPRRAYHR